MALKLLVGVFSSDHAVLAAAKAARAAGLGVVDAYTPYPVHGMDEALGLKPSWLPKACFALGALGLTGALAFQYWVSLFNWPMNIGGKSLDASPALVPIAFEITVLVSGVGTVLTLLFFRGLLPGKTGRFAELKATDDKFLLLLEGEDEAALRKVLTAAKALEIRDGEGGRP